MFLNKDFLEDYNRIAKSCSIDDGRKFNALNKEELVALLTYFYILYMDIRHLVSQEEIISGRIK